MSEQITMMLKRKLEDMAVYGGLDAETRRNALKEELQYYVLNFIYHHPEYGSWIMYGGSALRIIHGLDRMSVDLDFEISHPVTENYLAELKTDIEEHFRHTYGAGSDFMTAKVNNNRGLLLKFKVGAELSFGHPSKQVHVKIDLNHFVAPKIVIERRPINRDQMTFVVITYNMASLMASKLAAIFLRGTRGVGADVYQEKGRDIYDLLWYMGKKAVPDFDYLVAKGIDCKHIGALFNRLTVQMNKVSDKNLQQDLVPLFANKTYIGNWLDSWRESYLRLLDEYKIRTITNLRKIHINIDFGTDNFSFIFSYDTADGAVVSITYVVTWEWIHDGYNLGIAVNEDLIKLASVSPQTELNDQAKQFITLFYEKNEMYFKKTNMIMLGDNIVTKVIRMAAHNLNQKEQIVLNKSALRSCELDDLLK